MTGYVTIASWPGDYRLVRPITVTSSNETALFTLVGPEGILLWILEHSLPQKRREILGSAHLSELRPSFRYLIEEDWEHGRRDSIPLWNSDDAASSRRIVRAGRVRRKLLRGARNDRVPPQALVALASLWVNVLGETEGTAEFLRLLGFSGRFISSVRDSENAQLCAFARSVMPVWAFDPGPYVLLGLEPPWMSTRHHDFVAWYEGQL